jgi:predicted DNA-binding transcriptional regulator AlpA
MDPLLTIKDLAGILQLSTSAIYRMVARGDGPPVVNLPGGTLRIDPKDLQDWLDGHKKQPDVRRSHTQGHGLAGGQGGDEVEILRYK